QASHGEIELRLATLERDEPVVENPPGPAGHAALPLGLGVEDAVALHDERPGIADPDFVSREPRWQMRRLPFVDLHSKIHRRLRSMWKSTASTAPAIHQAAKKNAMLPCHPHRRGPGGRAVRWPCSLRQRHRPDRCTRPAWRPHTPRTPRVARSQKATPCAPVRGD